MKPGPPADPNALRRSRDGQTWIRLPPDGRKGRTPVWPLAPAATERELELWKKLWRYPQAVQWEKLGLSLEVALHVRTLREAERPKSTTAARTLAMRQQEALGLTSAALAKLHWVIPEVAPAQASAQGEDAQKPARERFGVIQGGGGK